MPQVPSILPPSVPPLGGIPAPARVANAQAKSKEVIVVLINLVFIVDVSLFCFFGLPWLPTVGGHFRPFTEVQNGNRREVTRKMEGRAPANPSRVWRRRAPPSIRLELSADDYLRGSGLAASAKSQRTADDADFKDCTQSNVG